MQKKMTPFDNLCVEVPELFDGLDWSFFDYAHISLRYKYIYVETPKAACSSIKTFLQRIELDDEAFCLPGELVHLRVYSPLLSPVQIGSFRKLLSSPSKYFIFCVVRNPFTRLLSAYLDKIQRNKPEKKKIVEALGIPDEMYFDHLEFGDFVEAVVNNPEKSSDAHWDMQAQHLKYKRVDYDFIARFENIERDVNVISEKIGAPAKFRLDRHGNEATNASRFLKDYYSDEIANRVVAHYNVDFKTFDYSTRWQDAGAG
jgi:hypothetical protein